jgi:hypothetical protein
MRSLKALSVLLVLPLSGCFVFIPGSVVSGVSDAITGSKGEHCVSRAAKVGDLIRTPDGRVFRVESLSGTSVRCTDSSLPIRAEMALLPDRPTLASVSTPLPPPPEALKAPTDAERAAACARMDAVKPGAPQVEFQAAWAELNRLGMTWRDCPR